jgi:hypothetical protein
VTRRIEVPRPLLADCEPGCPERVDCAGCDRALCADHSIDHVGCDATGDWHDPCHLEGCGPCQDEAAREWVQEHRW